MAAEHDPLSRLAFAEEVIVRNRTNCLHLLAACLSTLNNVTHTAPKCHEAWLLLKRWFAL